MDTFARLGLIFPRLEFLHLVNCPVYCNQPVHCNESQELCPQCDSTLQEMLASGGYFSKLRRYRQMRYRQVDQITLANGEVVARFEPKSEVWNYLPKNKNDAGGDEMNIGGDDFGCEYV